MRGTRYLWISNLFSNSSEEVIRNTFESYGKIQSIRIHDNEGARGAVLAFMDITSAAKALECVNKLGGVILKLEYCDSTGHPGILHLRQNSLPEKSTQRISSCSDVPNNRPLPSENDNISTASSRTDDRRAGSPDRSFHGHSRSTSRSSTHSGLSTADSTKQKRKNHKVVPRYRRRLNPGSGYQSTSHHSCQDERGSRGDGGGDRDSIISGSGRSSSGGGGGLWKGGPLRGLLVTQLPSRSTDTSIREGLFHEFKKHGKITSVVVETHSGGTSSRVAVITFKRHEDAVKAFENSHDKIFFATPICVELHRGYDIEDPDLCPPEHVIDEYHPKATKTLFVGNLITEIVTEHEIYKSFSKFGEIIDIDIKTQPNQINYSYAFIQFVDIRSVVQALNYPEFIKINGKMVKLGFGKSQPTNCIWLDDLAPTINDHYLVKQFKRFGQVIDVVLDKKLRRALVYFDSIDAAQNSVVEMKNRALAGRKTQMDYANNECQAGFNDRSHNAGRSYSFANRKQSSSTSSNLHTSSGYDNNYKGGQKDYYYYNWQSYDKNGDEYEEEKDRRHVNDPMEEEDYEYEFEYPKESHEGFIRHGNRRYSSYHRGSESKYDEFQTRSTERLQYYPDNDNHNNKKFNHSEVYNVHRHPEYSDEGKVGCHSLVQEKNPAIGRSRKEKTAYSRQSSMQSSRNVRLKQPNSSENLEIDFSENSEKFHFRYPTCEPLARQHRGASLTDKSSRRNSRRYSSIEDQSGVSEGSLDAVYVTPPDFDKTPPPLPAPQSQSHHIDSVSLDNIDCRPHNSRVDPSAAFADNAQPKPVQSLSILERERHMLLKELSKLDSGKTSLGDCQVLNHDIEKKADIVDRLDNLSDSNKRTCTLKSGESFGSRGERVDSFSRTAAISCGDQNAFSPSLSYHQYLPSSVNKCFESQISSHSSTQISSTDPTCVSSSSVLSVITHSSELVPNKDKSGSSYSHLRPKTCNDRPSDVPSLKQLENSILHRNSGIALSSTSINSSLEVLSSSKTTVSNAVPTFNQRSISCIENHPPRQMPTSLTTQQSVPATSVGVQLDSPASASRDPRLASQHYKGLQQHLPHSTTSHNVFFQQEPTDIQTSLPSSKPNFTGSDSNILTQLLHEVVKKTLPQNSVDRYSQPRQDLEVSSSMTECPDSNRDSGYSPRIFSNTEEYLTTDMDETSELNDPDQDSVLKESLSVEERIRLLDAKLNKSDTTRPAAYDYSKFKIRKRNDSVTSSQNTRNNSFLSSGNSLVSNLSSQSNPSNISGHFSRPTFSGNTIKTDTSEFVKSMLTTKPSVFISDSGNMNRSQYLRSLSDFNVDVGAARASQSSQSGSGSSTLPPKNILNEWSLPCSSSSLCLRQSSITSAINSVNSSNRVHVNGLQSNMSGINQSEIKLTEPPVRSILKKDSSHGILAGLTVATSFCSSTPIGSGTIRSVPTPTNIPLTPVGHTKSVSSHGTPLDSTWHQEKNQTSPGSGVQANSTSPTTPSGSLTPTMSPCVSSAGENSANRPPRLDLPGKSRLTSTHSNLKMLPSIPKRKLLSSADGSGKKSKVAKMDNHPALDDSLFGPTSFLYINKEKKSSKHKKISDQICKTMLSSEEPISKSKCLLKEMDSHEVRKQIQKAEAKRKKIKLKKAGALQSPDELQKQSSEKVHYYNQKKKLKNRYLTELKHEEGEAVEINNDKQQQLLRMKKSKNVKDDLEKHIIEKCITKKEANDVVKKEFKRKKLLKMQDSETEDEWQKLSTNQDDDEHSQDEDWKAQFVIPYESMYDKIKRRASKEADKKQHTEPEELKSIKPHKNTVRQKHCSTTSDQLTDDCSTGQIASEQTNNNKSKFSKVMKMKRFTKRSSDVGSRMNHLSEISDNDDQCFNYVTKLKKKIPRKVMNSKWSKVKRRRVQGSGDDASYARFHNKSYTTIDNVFSDASSDISHIDSPSRDNINSSDGSKTTPSTERMDHSEAEYNSSMGRKLLEDSEHCNHFISMIANKKSKINISEDLPCLEKQSEEVNSPRSIIEEPPDHLESIYDSPSVVKNTANEQVVEEQIVYDSMEITVDAEVDTETIDVTGVDEDEQVNYSELLRQDSKLEFTGDVEHNTDKTSFETIKTSECVEENIKVTYIKDREPMVDNYDKINPCSQSEVKVISSAGNVSEDVCTNIKISENILCKSVDSELRKEAESPQFSANIITAQIQYINSESSMALLNKPRICETETPDYTSYVQSVIERVKQEKDIESLHCKDKAFKRSKKSISLSAQLSSTNQTTTNWSALTDSQKQMICYGKLGFYTDPGYENRRELGDLPNSDIVSSDNFRTHISIPLSLQIPTNQGLSVCHSSAPCVLSPSIDIGDLRPPMSPMSQNDFKYRNRLLLSRYSQNNSTVTLDKAVADNNLKGREFGSASTDAPEGFDDDIDDEDDEDVLMNEYSEDNLLTKFKPQLSVESCDSNAVNNCPTTLEKEVDTVTGVIDAVCQGDFDPQKYLSLWSGQRKESLFVNSPHHSEQTVSSLDQYPSSSITSQISFVEASKDNGDSGIMTSSFSTVTPTSQRFQSFEDPYHVLHTAGSPVSLSSAVELGVVNGGHFPVSALSMPDSVEERGFAIERVPNPAIAIAPSNPSPVEQPSAFMPPTSSVVASSAALGAVAKTVTSTVMETAMPPDYSSQQQLYLYNMHQQPSHLNHGMAEVSSGPLTGFLHSLTSTTGFPVQIGLPNGACSHPSAPVHSDVACYNRQSAWENENVLCLGGEYPMLWKGRLSLKNEEVLVQMHLVHGNTNLIQACMSLLGGSEMPDQTQPTPHQPLKIVQRMRLEPAQLDGVERKMQQPNDFCVCLALASGANNPELVHMNAMLRDSFIKYMQEKSAAGIINVYHPKFQHGIYVVHIFPPCEFSRSRLQLCAPELLHWISLHDVPHLLIVITTV